MGKKRNGTYTTQSEWAGRPCLRSLWSFPLSYPAGLTHSCPCLGSYCPGRGNSSRNTPVVSAAPGHLWECVLRWEFGPASPHSWTAPWCEGRRRLQTESLCGTEAFASSSPWGTTQPGGPVTVCGVQVAGERPRAATPAGCASGFVWPKTSPSLGCRRWWLDDRIRAPASSDKGLSPGLTQSTDDPGWSSLLNSFQPPSSPTKAVSALKKKDIIKEGNSERSGKPLATKATSINYKRGSIFQ